jgi:signal transduction histidine kinase
MKPRMRVPEIDVRASIALIVLAIGLVGYIQFSWFRQSATVEIIGAYRSLNATVLQTMSREFQRYAPLIGDLRALAGGGEAPSGGRAAGSITPFLQREYELYGPSGSVPRLVSLVGTTTIAGSSFTSVLQANGSWKKGASPFFAPIPEAAERMLDDGELLVCGDADGDRQFLLAPSGAASSEAAEETAHGAANSRAVAVIELDAEGFFEAYTKPAVASILPDAKIEWTKSVLNGQQRTEALREARVGPPRRGFNPIRALLGIASTENRTFSIVVPATMDSFMMRGLGWFENWSSGSGGEGSFRPLQGGEGPDPRAAVIMRVAKIVESARSSPGLVERRLAFDWLFSVLLLIGLCIAFAQVVVQKHKLGVVSKREREFVASVTHELRTPVTAIRSAADNLRHGLIGRDRCAIYGEMIHEQSLRLGSMIEEVLLFSQVEGGTAQKPPLAPIRTEALDAELRTPLEAIARSEGMRIDWDFGSLPREFLSDAETLRLILSNLVANALFHAYPGPEKGAVRVVGKVHLPDSIQFFVEDDGRGIAKKEAALVFEAFYRDEESRARHEKGSGLGLFIARRKAILLGGDLALESPYERIDGVKRPGCRLTLEIPFEEQGDVR